MNYYNEIKNKLIDNEVYKRVKDYSKNRNDINTYYEVGKLLKEARKYYGEGIIKEYQRLDDKTKLKQINKEEIVVSDFIKNKYNYYIQYSSDNRIYTRDYVIS